MKKTNGEERITEDVTVLEDDEITIGNKETMYYWWAFGVRTDKPRIKWKYDIGNVSKADLLISFCKRVGYHEVERKQVPEVGYKNINGEKRKVKYNNTIVILEKIPAIE